MSQKTVTINGTIYDAHTGLPVTGSDTADTSSQKSAAAFQAPQPKPHSATVHSPLQKSQTLNRRTVQKTAPARVQPVQTRSAVQKSPMVTKFAPHPSGIKQPGKTVTDIGPTVHPSVARANQQLAVRHQADRPTAPKPSQVIKQEAIQEAIDRAPSHNSEPIKTKKSRKLQKLTTIGSISLALLLLGGYFTYLNMPNLSVRVAAAQAGVNATYPEYRPDGYSLSGAVAYSQGQVSMKFASNTGPQNFTILQSKSNWDSSAVLDNYVKQKAGDNYITYNERGLTIYTYGSNAAWVNGGILYTINGDAPLSSDQIRRIATSM